MVLLLSRSTKYFSMPLPTWGDLAKSSEDPQKINAAVDAAIESHNDDPDSHIGAGQSLQSHKAAEIIDHVAHSIVNDKILYGEVTQDKLSATHLQAYIAFESLDGWNYKTGGVTPAVLGAVIQTGDTINTERYLSSEPYGMDDMFSAEKEIFFQTSVCFSADDDQLAYFVAGSLAFDDTDQSFGFKIADGQVYAVVIISENEERHEHSALLSGVDILVPHVYKAYWDTLTSEIYFYIDGVLKYTEDNNVPLFSSPVMFTYYLKNTVAANRAMFMNYLFFSRSI